MLRTNGLTNKWSVLFVVGIATYIYALDGGVVTATLPLVTRSLQSTIGVTQWVITAYLLVISATLLTFGRLGDMRGQKRLYAAGFAVFTLGSALCGTAPTAFGLIAFRALQALGAAMLFASGPAILTKSFPGEQRGQALGIQATMTYLGLATGPSLGGFLAAHYGWRAVFYINLPIGALGLALVPLVLPADTDLSSNERFDLLGAAISLLALTTLLAGLNQGPRLGWGSPIVLGLLAAAVVFGGAFVRVERTAAQPMLDLNLFRQRQFSSAIVSALLNYLCVFGGFLLMPFYLVEARGLATDRAGLILTVQPLVMALVAPFSGGLSDRIGPRYPASAGMFVLSAGMFFLSTLSANSPLGNAGLALAVVGLGIGLFTSPNNSALMGSAPRERQGIAAGVLAIGRNVGMLIGIATAGAIYSSRLFVYQQAGGAWPTLAAQRDAFWTLAAVAAIGGVISLVRGSRPVSARPMIHET
ncbi:MAG: MFS transporter [Chloroflexi bacterium]|nr:MFS transporter [Chloroflexota bacterium]